MRYSINLTANVPHVQPFRAKGVTVMDVGAASAIDLTLFAGGEQNADGFGEVGRNFSIFSPDVAFTGAQLLAAVNCTVELLVTNFRVETMDGANLTVTLGASNVPMQVREDIASAVIDNAAVAVTHVATLVKAANALRKSIRFQNVGASPAALGAAGIAWAARSVVLDPGDVFIEDRGANVAWYAITSANPLTASITAQEVLA